MSNPTEQTYDEDALATAFLAGFMASGEYFHGEDIREDMPVAQVNARHAEVLAEFDMWMLDVAASYDA